MPKLKEIDILIKVSLSTPDGDAIESTNVVSVLVEDPKDDAEIAMEAEARISELVSWKWERL